MTETTSPGSLCAHACSGRRAPRYKFAARNKATAAERHATRRQQQKAQMCVFEQRADGSPQVTARCFETPPRSQPLARPYRTSGRPHGGQVRPQWDPDTGLRDPPPAPQTPGQTPGHRRGPSASPQFSTSPSQPAPLSAVPSRPVPSAPVPSQPAPLTPRPLTARSLAAVPSLPSPHPRPHSQGPGLPVVFHNGA